MSWKSRGKQVTLQEAIANAKMEATPYWHGSPPIFTAYPIEGKNQLFPLDPVFEKQPWMIAIRDITHPSALTDLPLLQEFYERYSAYGLGILLIAQPRYSYF